MRTPRKRRARPPDPALDILTDLVRVESARLTDLAKKHCFVGNLYGKIVAALISAESFSEPLKKELMEKYLNVLRRSEVLFLQGC